MDRQPIAIRPASPTREDGLRFAHYVDIASEGKFRLLLGRRASEILGTAFQEPKHNLSYENTLFAKLGGEIVGMATGYTAQRHCEANDRALMRAAGRSKLRIACMFALAAPVFRFLHTYEEGDFYVEFLAVDEAHRGKGIGSKLIEAMQERALAAGSIHFAIDVAGRNESARRLYERHGFTTINRWPKTRLVRPNILRMRKPLALDT